MSLFSMNLLPSILFPPLPHKPPSHQLPLLPHPQLDDGHLPHHSHFPTSTLSHAPATAPSSEPIGRRPSGLACVIFVGLVLLWAVHLMLEDQPLILLHGLRSSLVWSDPAYRASWTAVAEPGAADLEHELLLPVHSNGTGQGWTVLLLHGLGDHRGSDAFGLRDALLAVQPELFGAMRFVIPFAPTLPISVFGGGIRSAWFDIASWADVHADEDEKHMRENVKGLSRLIRRHAIDLDRTIIGGFSQGAVMSLLLGLTLDHPPAGLIMFSGYAPLPTRLPTLIPLHPPRTSPVLHWLHGALDPFFTIGIARNGFEKIKYLDYFKTLKFDEVQNLEHRWVIEEVDLVTKTIEEIVHSFQLYVF